MRRPSLTYANVVATIALVVAVSGGATAAALNLSKGSVTTKSIRKGAITAPKLAPVVVRTATAEGPFAQATAPCAKGERVLAGGGSASGPGGGTTAISFSRLVGNGWGVGGTHTAGASISVRAEAVCLRK